MAIVRAPKSNISVIFYAMPRYTFYLCAPFIPVVVPCTQRNPDRLFLAPFLEFPMEIKVNFLDKLRLEAKFDDFTVVADQPIRYKGDGSRLVLSIIFWLPRPCVQRIL